MACALGLAHEGVGTILLAGPHRAPGGGDDRRTAALFGCSIDLLVNLGVFELCESASAPVRAIRIVDDTDRLFRAPEALFRADDIDRETFGFNVPQLDLVNALGDVAQSAGDKLEVIHTAGVVDIAIETHRVVLRTSEGAQFEAPVVAAADGRNSMCRDAAGIRVSNHELRQSALVTTFAHSGDHHGISTEFHRRAGPFTVVPMTGRRSSLVWVEHPQVAKRLLDQAEERFRSALEARLHGLLGDIEDVGPRSVFPLGSRVANEMARRRIALIGESGHAIPPIGAQGLNMGFHDGAVFVDIVRDAKRSGFDLGSGEVMRCYNQARWLDVHGRVGVVDVLNGSLISRYEALQFVRGTGLHVLKNVGPLRRWVLRKGLEPFHALPSLMRSLDESGARRAV